MCFLAMTPASQFASAWWQSVELIDKTCDHCFDTSRDILSTTVAVIVPLPRIVVCPPVSTAEAAGATGDIDVADAEAAFDGAKSEALVSKPLWGGLAALCFAGAFGYAFVGLLQDVGLAEALKVVIQNWLLVILIGMIVIYGFWRGVKVYDALIEGAREGFDVALRIIPYMVAILVAVGAEISGGLTCHRHLIHTAMVECRLKSFQWPFENAFWVALGAAEHDDSRPDC